MSWSQLSVCQKAQNLVLLFLAHPPPHQNPVHPHTCAYMYMYMHTCVQCRGHRSQVHHAVSYMYMYPHSAIHTKYTHIYVNSLIFFGRLILCFSLFPFCGQNTHVHVDIYTRNCKCIHVWSAYCNYIHVHDIVHVSTCRYTCTCTCTVLCSLTPSLLLLPSFHRVSSYCTSFLPGSLS